MKNEGIFNVELAQYENEGNKYIIVYYEKGIPTVLEDDKYMFDNYDEAYSYVQDHQEELDEYITSLKEAKAKEEEEKRLALAVKEEEERKEKEEEEKEKKKRKSRNKERVKGAIAAIVATALLVGSYILGKRSEKNNVLNESIKAEDATPVEEPSKDSLVNNLTYEEEQPAKEEVTIEKEEIEQNIENIQEEDNILNTENFEDLVAGFASMYATKGIELSTEDITKFVSIVNIDKLSEENQELTASLFNTQASEEYMNDAFKLIGSTVMYNMNMYNASNNTDNFVWISSSVADEDQRNKVIVIEDYVKKIALADQKGDVEELNTIVSEFLDNLNNPTGELSYLDDGVGLGIQVYIALIRDCVARNYLNQENFDMLTELTSSEKYISNIKTVYEGCNTASEAYTRSLSK